MDILNWLLFTCLQMEAIIERMQDESTGVPVRTVKSFMSKVPSVFTGEHMNSGKNSKAGMGGILCLFLLFCCRVYPVLIVIITDD